MGFSTSQFGNFVDSHTDIDEGLAEPFIPPELLVYSTPKGKYGVGFRQCYGGWVDRIWGWDSIQIYQEGLLLLTLGD